MGACNACEKTPRQMGVPKARLFPWSKHKPADPTEFEKHTFSTQTPHQGDVWIMRQTRRNTLTTETSKSWTSGSNVIPLDLYRSPGYYPTHEERQFRFHVQKGRNVRSTQPSEMRISPAEDPRTILGLLIEKNGSSNVKKSESRRDSVSLRCLSLASCDPKDVSKSSLKLKTSTNSMLPCRSSVSSKEATYSHATTWVA
mmetsp:Transcript_39144/g.75949  ORF Transcript_39144/g.75949 Transcript_39144/m.75949 type:complete len:199 (+) Transcript_39144:77-673(+)